MPRRKRHLSQQDLRAMGASPGRLATRYTPDGGRAEVRQLTSEAKTRPRLRFGPELTHIKKTSEGEMTETQTPSALIGELTAELMGELDAAHQEAPIAALVAVWVDGGVWWRVHTNDPLGGEDPRVTARLAMALGDAALTDKGER
jgi:hypothetical protein